MLKKSRERRSGTTLDGLARMIQGEFSASRKETNERFNKVDDDISWIHGSLDVLRREISEIRNELGKVVYRHELEALQTRVATLEKKLGVRK